jgi:hypothetical protein
MGVSSEPPPPREAFELSYEEAEEIVDRAMDNGTPWEQLTERQRRAAMTVGLDDEEDWQMELEDVF